jgi:hypothetical protein
MRSRSVAAAITLSVICAGGALTCFLQASRLRTEAEWFLARSNAQAQEYANTLDSAVAEQQLVSFEQRRALLERAHIWQRVQLLLILGAVLTAFSSYVLYLFRRLREQLVDAEEVESGNQV